VAIDSRYAGMRSAGRTRPHSAETTRTERFARTLAASSGRRASPAAGGGSSTSTPETLGDLLRAVAD